VTAVLDHLAIGTSVLADGWDLFGGVLGGRWAYGSDSEGFWWGQLDFAAGPKIELLTPNGEPGGSFLDRFLAARGAGPHHFNFAVTDIESTLARIRAAGIEPVGVNLDDPTWKEAFLHPRSAHGIVIQVAQQDGPAPLCAPPPDLPEPGPATRLDLIEHHVVDLDGAVRLFRDVLDGELTDAGTQTADLSWPGAKRIRLVREEDLPHGGTLHHIRFTRVNGPFTDRDRALTALLSKRLGTPIHLSGAARKPLKAE